MSKVVRARHKGKVFQPSWNQNGFPVGEESVTLMSYWGEIIRKNVPINIVDWKHVPQRLKDTLFEEVVVLFSINI